MLKIVKAEEAIQVKNIVVAVYGQPGIGKSTLGFGAESPLMLDFDRGAHRAVNRGDTVQVERWADVSGMSADDLSPYKTIIVDTVGRLLDCLATHLISDNPKLKGYGGALSLQGYGALKSAYSGWLKLLMSYGKDIVLIAHDKEDKNGDDLIIRPDIQGGSYGEVIKSADAVGYLHIVGRDRVLDFSPTDKWVGKNAAGFSPLVVPPVAVNPAFFGGVIRDIKEAMNKLSEDQKAALKQVEDWRTVLSECETADDINARLDEVKKLADPVASQVKALLVSRTKALGLVADKKSGTYKAMEAA